MKSLNQGQSKLSIWLIPKPIATHTIQAISLLSFQSDNFQAQELFLSFSEPPLGLLLCCQVAGPMVHKTYNWKALINNKKQFHMEHRTWKIVEEIFFYSD